MKKKPIIETVLFRKDNFGKKYIEIIIDGQELYVTALITDKKSISCISPNNNQKHTLIAFAIQTLCNQYLSGFPITLDDVSILSWTQVITSIGILKNTETLDDDYRDCVNSIFIQSLLYSQDWTASTREEWLTCGKLLAEITSQKL